MRQVLLVMLMVLVGCAPPPPTGTGGGSGTTGGGSGSTGGGSQSTGGGAATGGGSGTTTFSVSGTARAPSGVDLAGSHVIACAWVNDTCDDTESIVVTLSTTGQTAPFLIDDLKRGLTYFVVLWKDVDGNQDVNDGDYFGLASNADGDVVAIADAATGLSVTMALRAPTTSTTIPASLRGSWSKYTPTSSGFGIVNTWDFRANDTVNNTYSLVYSSCSSRHTTTSVDGVGAINGSSFVFSPSTARRTEQQCNEAPTTTSVITNTRNFTWRVGTQTAGDGGTALFLTEQGMTTEVEFAKD